ncbi:ABC transporter permease [Allohahella marinimesophila]|uniref:Phosphonate transport system permease protein n=1 Tax=Allohahella marinimesophila TaxID=1054972 RepID=A0ABP7PVC9_9GAMM
MSDPERGQVKPPLPLGLGSATVRVSLIFLGVAFVSLLLGDIEITTSDPWGEMLRFAGGFLTPSLDSIDTLATALLRTVGFAFVGVALGSIAGYLLMLFFDKALVRAFCAFIRAIHELFWALIFLQFFGLHPLTGVLAIAIPYAGVFAKVYAEINDETDPLPGLVLPPIRSRFIQALFLKLPQAFAHVKSYTAYRLECGFRSSAILGFVGLPTLGFYLESAFVQGHYSEVAAMLMIFYLIIATMRWWLRPRLLPLYVLASPFFLGEGLPIVWSNVGRFFTEDIVPAPLKNGVSWSSPSELWEWFSPIAQEQIVPGLWNTVILTQIALVATAILTLIAFVLVSKHFGGAKRRSVGHLFLVVGRSTPEYILAYMLLQLWGPSMLPAVVALALHNGCIIGHLIGRQSNELVLRPGTGTGTDLYFFELLPRLYRPFLAFLFYRWEIIMRETAILGVLGIYTLGFYIDSAIENIRFDVALLLILVTAMLNIAIDMLSRKLRAGLRLTTMPTPDVP